MFENPKVLPTLVKALGKDPERQSVLQALDQYLEKRPAQANLARVLARSCEAAIHPRPGDPGLA